MPVTTPQRTIPLSNNNEEVATPKVHKAAMAGHKAWILSSKEIDRSEVRALIYSVLGKSKAGELARTKKMDLLTS